MIGSDESQRASDDYDDSPIKIIDKGYSVKTKTAFYDLRFVMGSYDQPQVIKIWLDKSRQYIAHSEVVKYLLYIRKYTHEELTKFLEESLQVQEIKPAGTETSDVLLGI